MRNNKNINRTGKIKNNNKKNDFFLLDYFFLQNHLVDGPRYIPGISIKRSRDNSQDTLVFGTSCRDTLTS